MQKNLFKLEFPAQKIVIVSNSLVLKIAFSNLDIENHLKAKS